MKVEELLYDFVELNDYLLNLFEKKVKAQKKAWNLKFGHLCSWIDHEQIFQIEVLSLGWIEHWKKLVVASWYLTVTNDFG
jgi:hypothetical protein